MSQQRFILPIAVSVLGENDRLKGDLLEALHQAILVAG